MVYLIDIRVIRSRSELDQLSDEGGSMPIQIRALFSRDSPLDVPPRFEKVNELKSPGKLRHFKYA